MQGSVEKLTLFYTRASKKHAVKMLACVVGMHDDFTFILKAGLSFVPTLQDST